MKPRNSRIILLYQVVTLGFYFIYWCWRSKNEVNRKAKGIKAPSVWWFLLPFGGYWWAWQYSQAVESATGGKLRYSDVFGFFLVATLGVLGSFWLPWPTDFSGEEFSGTEAAIYFGLLYLAVVLVASIFPIAMQNRFNKLAKR
jgi:hypothetical protein